MNKIKKEDIKQEVFDLYDKYAHNQLDRREFMQKLSLFAGGGLTVPALMGFLMPDYTTTSEVRPDDPRIRTTYASYSSPKGGGTIKGLLAWPANAKEKLGAVLVVHENRGLNPYIEDVARRAAAEGFLAFAPDALTPLGGYPGNDDEGRVLQAKRSRAEMEEDFIAAFHYLQTHKQGNGHVGVVGFCFGGAVANMLAVRIPELKASVPFYGSQPDLAEVPRIASPLMLHFASLDKRITDGWPAYEAALKQANKSYEAFIYEGANHGFHNNTTPRYDEAAATLAWKRTIGFFKKHLS